MACKTTLIGILLSALFAAAPARSQTTPQRGGSVVVAIAGDPSVLNPAVTTASPDQLVGCAIYEGLTEVSGSGPVTPLLAKSWTISDDGKTYDFKLNIANWQDGKPFTSADVKFSLLEINAKSTPGFAAGAGKFIIGIATPAPDEAVLTLSQPFGPLLRSLTCQNGGAILPQHIFQGMPVMSNPATTTSPVGTGPLKFVAWQHGAFIRLARNPDYWNSGKPYVDEVLIQSIPQASSRTQALQSGEVDYLPYFFLATNDLPMLRQNPKLTVAPARLPPSQDMLFINVRHKPLDDKRVRQALLMATDRAFLLKSGWLGIGNVGRAPFTTALTWAANPAIDYEKMYPFDPAKANALLDEAGVPRGPDGIRFKFNLVFVSDEVDLPRVAAAIKQMWRAVGVDVVLGSYDRPTAEKRVFNDLDFDGHLNGYTSWGDPALGLARIFVTASVGKFYGNASGYSNPAVDALFAEAERGSSEAARGAIYARVQTILAEDLPVLTLHERVSYDVYNATIQDAATDAYFPTWKNEWLKK